LPLSPPGPPEGGGGPPGPPGGGGPPGPAGGGPPPPWFEPGRAETRAANNYQEKNESKGTHCSNNKRTYESDADDKFNHICVFCLSLLSPHFPLVFICRSTLERKSEKDAKEEKKYILFLLIIIGTQGEPVWFILFLTLLLIFHI